MQNIRFNDLTTDKSHTNPIDLPQINSKDSGTGGVKRSPYQDLPLRNINMKQPFYGQQDVKKTAVDELTSRLDSGQKGNAMKNSMVLAASGMTKQDFSKMKEDGFLPEDLDEETFVTVADKIRIQLAKGGADISMMGGVSDAAVEAVAGSTGSAKAIESALESAMVPVDEGLSQDIETALKKASEITDITDDTRKYLINNELEPTIENVYKANFSISEKYSYSNFDRANPELLEGDLEALEPQIEETIKKAGYAATSEAMESAKWLLKEELPVTEETLSGMNDLKGEVKRDKAEVAAAITETVIQGKSPEDAYIIYGVSERERASKTMEKVAGITDTKIENAIKTGSPMTLASIYAQEDSPMDGDFQRGSKQEYEMVSARRSMEEIRLSMTFEVSISMQRRGISVDTTELSSLVDQLKSRENQLYELLLGGGKGADLDTKINLFNQTNSALSQIKNYPAATLGYFSQTTEITISSLSTQGSAMASRMKAAGESYETLMTMPRADLGDSIKKAFRNVDDILEDLGMDTTESNERAVRILGYNSLDITKESVLEMRSADEMLRGVFKNLTPAVVAKMIKEGENPLDMSLPKLDEKINELKIEDADISDQEGFAEFLYKAQQNNELSDEQRESFIGIYRLMHQVTKSDGAVIGALLHQGREITMRSMMSAIRSNKHKNMDATIDDNFGLVSGFKKESLSITQQIEMAFQTSRMQDAKDVITPGKLAAFDSEDTYMNMTPDELASALEDMGDIPREEAAYIEQLQREVNRAVQSETKVYEALRQFDLPVTPANLTAMENFMADRNGVYRKVFSRTLNNVDLENIDTKEVMADIMRRFGEAVKTPEDMADAQQKLAETATNVMRDMLVEQEVGHIDVRGMRVAMTQIKMLGQISREAENYTIPIMVADENGTLNLKIVRGSNEDNGLVDIAFNMDRTGQVSATFKASAQGITGSINCVKSEIEGLLKEQEESLTGKLSEITETSVSINFTRVSEMSDEELYGDKDPGFETTTERVSVQTDKLYAMAKAFIDILGEI